MKDLLFADKIIPANSITSLEISKNPIDNTYSIVLRQGIGQQKIFTNSDYDVVKNVFDEMKKNCDGFYFGDLVASVIVNKKTQEEKPKTKTRKSKKSMEVDNNVK